MAWTPEQLANARFIISVGQSMGMSQRDIQIGLMTAMQESGLRNLNYGDGSSTGLFQQTDAWGGTDAQHQDRQWATTSFFTALKGISDRSSMSLTQAAQAVQRSAYPDAYAKWSDEAAGLLGLGAGAGAGVGAGSAPTPPVSGLGLGTGAALGEAPVSSSPSPIGLQATMPEAQSGSTAIAAPQTQSISALGLTDGPAAPLGLTADTSMPFMPTIPGMGAPGDPVGTTTTGSGTGLTGAWQKKVVGIAKGLLGIPYVWGGTTTQGFDCSGFVQYVYKQMGIDLPRISYQQANYGQHIALKDLQVGDLVAWDNSSRNVGADHVAIYLGNGMIIEAPRPGMSVQISQLYDQSIAWGVRMHA